MKSVNKISSIATDYAPLNEVTFLDKKVKQQIAFVNQCIHSGTTMTSALKSAGKSYDDLIYMNNHRQILRDNRYFTLEDFTERSNDIPVSIISSVLDTSPVCTSHFGLLNLIVSQKRGTFSINSECEKPAASKPRSSPPAPEKKLTTGISLDRSVKS